MTALEKHKEQLKEQRQYLKEIKENIKEHNQEVKYHLKKLRKLEKIEPLLYGRLDNVTTKIFLIQALLSKKEWKEG